MRVEWRKTPVEKEGELVRTHRGPVRRLTRAGRFRVFLYFLILGLFLAGLIFSASLVGALISLGICAALGFGFAYGDEIFFFR